MLVIPGVAPYAEPYMQTIIPFLWFDTQAKDAVDFYTSLFPNSHVGAVARYPEDTPGPAGEIMTVSFTLAGQQFTALNGGPIFKFTPGISLFVSCETVEEAEALWHKLVDGGSVLMEFQKYPYSEKYGWLQDKFGLSWQIFTGHKDQKITPSLLFSGEQLGKAEDAMKAYTALFPNSKILQVERYPDGMPTAGKVMYGECTLNGYNIIAMDSGNDHKFTFTEALSFEVDCDTQQEIDTLWNALSASPENEQCGWLKDAYGVSWQIVPVRMQELMSTGDSEQSYRVMQAMLQMKKLDIATLERAAADSGK